NSVPVAQATIKRERMEEILRDAIEADRQGRMPSDEEIDKLSHGFALQYQDHVRGFARALLSRYSSGQPAANADPLEVLRRVWQPHTQSNVDRMSEQDIAREIEEEVARQQKEEPIGFLVPATLGRQPTFIPRDR